jgi:hypothetical protein
MRVVAVIDAPDFSSEGTPEPTAAAKALNESAMAAPTPTEAPKLVALATELEDLGIVEAKKAKAIAQEHADGSGEAVILRDPTSDKLLKTVEPKGKRKQAEKKFVDDTTTATERLTGVKEKTAKAKAPDKRPISKAAATFHSNVAAMPASKGTFKAETPKKAQAERNTLAASLKVGATAPLGHKESKPKPASGSTLTYLSLV